MKDSNADNPSTLNHKPHGTLVGRAFVIWGDNREWRYQGYVSECLWNGYYLVRYFDAMGDESTMAIWHISKMAVTGDSDRAPNGWTFFEDNNHLNYWVENVDRSGHRMAAGTWGERKS